MFIVEKMVNGGFQPIGCADSFSNALKLLAGRSGKIEGENNRKFIIVSNY